MNCPVCGSKELLKRVVFYDDKARELLVQFTPVHFGKYDTPEPGNYECLNEGHEFEVIEPKYSPINF